MKRNLLLLLFVSFSFSSFSQQIDASKALQLVKENKLAIGLSDTDIKDAMVSDAYYDNTANLQMVYLQQNYMGIPVYNQIQVLAFRNGQMVSNTGGRIKSISKIAANNQAPAITAQIAVTNALSDRKIKFNTSPRVQKIDKEGRLFVFDDMGVSRQEITAELMWVPLQDGKKVELAWQVYIIPTTTSDYWLVRISANDGKTIGISNLTVYCNWDKQHDKSNSDIEKATVNNADENHDGVLSNKNTTSPSIINGASYRVIPYPAESPIHIGGSPALVTSPWTNTPGNATTLKWHSTSTSDYTITRGNNVWAQEDRNNNNGIGTPATSTTTTDPLSFDFTPNFTAAPTQTSPSPNQQFNTTNLFYWNNLMHDLTYLYGFDEPSGNLDSANAKQLHQLFFELRNEMNQTFVIVTHNNELADMADRKLTIKDGII